MLPSFFGRNMLSPGQRYAFSPSWSEIIFTFSQVKIHTFVSPGKAAPEVAAQKQCAMISLIWRMLMGVDFVSKVRMSLSLG